MINLDRFKYKKDSDESPNPDIVPETPPKQNGVVIEKVRESIQKSRTKRKFVSSSDEDSSDRFHHKKSRITHFLKTAPVIEKSAAFISPDSGSDGEPPREINDENGLHEDKEMSDRVASLKELFSTTSEETLRKVADLSCTIHGAIATLSQWSYEDLKNNRKSPSSRMHDCSQNSTNSSFDSPVFARKVNNRLRLDSDEKTFPPYSASKIVSKKSSKRLNLSSSSSESETEEPEKPKGPFPRLTCVVSNPKKESANDEQEKSSKSNVPHSAKLISSSCSLKKPNGIMSFYSKASKVKKSSSTVKASSLTSARNSSFNDACLTEDNAADENFNLDDDIDLSSDEESEFSHLGIYKRKKILEFFQNSSTDEISTVHTCSKKKVDILIGLRPYENWNDLVDKLERTKSVSTDLINHCADLLKERIILRNLLEQCGSISDKLNTDLESHRFRCHMTEGKNVLKAPSTVPSHLVLKPYQLVGMNWIALLRRHGVNGVLADEMGLGKTVQTIAFLAHLFEENPETGPHLIVVPSSTIDNWRHEFSLWCPSMKVVMYHGSQAERRSIRAGFLHERITANVIITTYNCAISCAEDRVFLRKMNVEYAVFDEGHMLKNMSSQRYLYLMKIKATRRLLLTGTPLQNNLLELMSLLRFVMPHMFEQTTDTLIRIFSAKSNSNNEFMSRRIQDAKKIMQPFVLRRLKEDVLKQLPDKENEVLHCEMTEPQKIYYEETKERYQKKLHKKSRSELKNAFIELRKVANHPLLRRNQYTMDQLTAMAKLLKKDMEYADSEEHLIVEDMQVMTDFEIHRFCKTTRRISKYALEDASILDSGKFQMLDKLLEKFKSQNEKVLIFSQFTMLMDIMEEYLKLRNHKYMRLDGQTQVTDRLALIDEFNNDPSIFIFMLSTKAGGLGINLTSASVVILHDIDMNPYNDKQAEDRCHRLGQTKSVKVMRLLSKGTIEEGMLRCAQSKLQLEKDMIGKEETNDIAALLKEALSA